MYKYPFLLAPLWEILKGIIYKTKGVCQGNGASPAAWGVVSISIILAHNKCHTGPMPPCPWPHLAACLRQRHSGSAAAAAAISLCLPAGVKAGQLVGQRRPQRAGCGRWISRAAAVVDGRGLRVARRRVASRLHAWLQPLQLHGEATIWSGSAG